MLCRKVCICLGELVIFVISDMLVKLVWFSRFEIFWCSFSSLGIRGVLF